MPVLESIGGVAAAVRWVASPLSKKKLEEAERNILPEMKAAIEEAEGSPLHRSVLQRLKDAYDDAEDALDLLHYSRLRRKVAAANGKRRTNLVPKGVRDALSPKKIRLKRKLHKLEKIAGEAKKLRARPDQTAAAPDSRQTISAPPAKVFGRDEDRAEIIRRLKTEPAAGAAAGLPMIAIVGRPGVGKTVLAQRVCEKLRSESGGGRFHLVMWVYASCNFNASEIMRGIIQQASIASESQDPVNRYDRALNILDTMATGNLESEELRLKMHTKLNVKKCLLVIDDVWCDGEDHRRNWNTLFRCLGKCCLPGSKILVTSQVDDAPRKIAAAIGAALEFVCHLEDLEENGFVDLFVHHVLWSGEINPRLREDFEESCKTIAKKLNKDPTAAKMVGHTIGGKVANLLPSQGNLLVYLDEIAHKDWSDAKTKALTWSYQHLPAHLQRCFSYCSLYPCGYKFKALELVQLWMAQGFLKPDGQNERMEDASYDYLEKLVSRFYIQSYDGYYVLHQLLYNLATKVSSRVCLRLEGKKEKIPSTIRHLCIPADELNENTEEICKLEKLRTLILTKGKSATSKEKVATDIFKSLQKLRVLVLESNLENLAEFISEMKHLRVLRVSGTDEFLLPESVCTLYQLQVLEVENASSLPTGLSNLVGLRYLQPSGIADIGKLTSLQRLEIFQVRKEKGYELEQLQNLNELRGSLCIDNLENVESMESAIGANLKEKKHLDMLQLVWREGAGNVNSNFDVGILRGLRLPPYLTSLHVDGYGGRLLLAWYENPRLTTIEELALRRCGMLEKLPPLNMLYPHCTSLELRQMSRLKELRALPWSLGKLAIIQTPLLTFVTKEDLQMSPGDKRYTIEVMRKRTQEWFRRQYQLSLVDNEKEMRDFIAATNDSNNRASSREHNSVPAAEVDIIAVWERWLETYEQKMELIYNRQYEARLLLPSTLTKLWLEGCNITDHALSVCLETVTSLTYLSLAEIKTVTCLPSGDVFGKLTSLQDVTLRECWALTSLGVIKSLYRLTDLRLIGCPCLDSKDVSLPPSLQSILFESCADVDVILANSDLACLSGLMIAQCHMRKVSLQFGNLPSLHSLSIRHCPGLSSLVNVQQLHSLEFLILENCSSLEPMQNLPGSLKGLGIRGCPILEANIDTVSGVRMLGGIPVEDDFETCFVM